MNIQNAIKLRDALKEEAELGLGLGFDMSFWMQEKAGEEDEEEVFLYAEMPEQDVVKSCGTAACLAGWCAVLGEAERGTDISEFALGWLGAGIFFGGWSWNRITDISREEAIEYLNACIKAGFALRRSEWDPDKKWKVTS